MSDTWTAAERTAFEARRKARSLALGLLLAALAVLFFGISMVRMAPQLAGAAPATASQVPQP